MDQDGPSVHGTKAYRLATTNSQLSLPGSKSSLANTCPCAVLAHANPAERLTVKTSDRSRMR
jgi:hypothetical protein